VSVVRPHQPPSQVRRVRAIDELIDRADSASRRARALRLLLIGTTVIACAVLLAVVLDATFPMAPRGLLTVDILIVGAVLVGPWILMRRALRGERDPRHLARLLEARTGVHNNEIINALEFERETRGAGASAELVNRTIEVGERLAPTIGAEVVVDRGVVRRVFLWMLAAPAAALILHLAIPHLFSMTLRRFADPFGFHPPFTSVRFAIAVNPESVKYGRPALITAEISGPVPAESADIVFVDPSDPRRELTVVAMIPEPGSEGGSSSGIIGSDDLFALRIDRAVESGYFVVRTPHGRSDLQRFEVLPVPSFERAGVTIRSPAYTEWPPLDRPFGSADVNALRDSTIEISARATLPLREGNLTLTTPSGEKTTIPMVPSAADPREILATFRATQAGTLELGLDGADGTESDEPRTGTLLVTDDQPPTIRVLDPLGSVYVVEGWTVDVVFEAEDDVGIDHFELTRSVNGFTPTTVPLPVSGGDRTRSLARAHFDTSELGAKAGDVLQCNALVWDAHPAPPHSARSTTVTIEVMSQSEYEELTRIDQRLEELTKDAAKFDAELQRLAEERAAVLQELDRIEAAEAAGESMAEARQELARQLDAFAEKSKELAERMRQRAEQPSLYDAEKPWQESLKKQAEGLDQQAQTAGELGGACKNPGDGGEPNSAGERSANGTPSPSPHAAKAGGAFRKSSEPFGSESMAGSAETVEGLAKMAAAEKLLDRVEKVRAAILEQRDVADQMAEFRQKNELSPQESLRLDDLAQEQDALGQRLEEARSELAKAATEAQETLPNMAAQAAKIADAIESLEAIPDQHEASKAARKGQGREAHTASERAAEKLEQLLSECSGEKSQEPMSSDLDGCLKMPKPSLRQALQQMANARLGQMSSLGGKPGSKGRRGSGTSGMSATASILGPHRPQGKPTRESNKVGNDAESKVAADGSLAPTRANGAESLEASAAGTTTGAGTLHGVPTPYRADAAAYFRRIAEDGGGRIAEDGGGRIAEDGGGRIAEDGPRTRNSSKQPAEGGKP